MKIIRIILVILLSGFVVSVQGALTEKAVNKRVLFISSNQAGQTTSQRILVSFIREFRFVPFKLDLNEIYLGSKQVMNLQDRRLV